MGADRYRNDYGNNVAVIGASSKRDRYSNKAVRALVEAGYNVYPVHPTESEIEGLRVFPDLRSIEGDIDLVSIYLKPQIVLRSGLVGHLQERGIKAAILNPGTQDPALIEELESSGITVLLECTLVNGLGRSPSEL
ncbi:MAG: CoA-binding protein [Candidatus Undinarchaeales archaeon]|jgi:hypothetical protein|nr:CoA-binding protein [Candidatus Undinarchaeales archaeon]MDP7494593.1 CoA-binding protein [Candidatus Undinarchaeales archaeon]